MVSVIIPTIENEGFSQEIYAIVTYSSTLGWQGKTLKCPVLQGNATK
jgi:hypothetical protein